MSNDPTPASNPDQPEKTPPVRKKRRRWLVVVGSLFVLLILLVLLLPTIASTSPARSFVLGQINDQINGRVEIDSWSLGWFSPTRVSGIKVYDDEKRLILDVPQVKLGISLSQALRQDFALGNVNVIDVDSFLVNIDETQHTNLERLPKSRARKPAASPAAGEIKLPNVSGTFTVNFRGTIEGSGVKAPVHVDPSTAVVVISNINEPIENKVRLAYRVGEGPVSTIETSGTVAAIKNNIVDAANFAAGQKINYNVNLAAVGPFIGVFPEIKGVMTGGVQITAQGITGLSADGEIVVDGLVVGGGPLGKDTFQTQRIAIPVKITRTATTGGDSIIKFENVGVKMNQATVAVTGQVTEQSLRNLMEKKAPGADGSITLTADITDFKDLATQFKNTLHLQEGVAITGGAGHEQLTIALTKDKVTIAQDLKVQASGTRNGQPIELKPITMTANASAIPNGKSIPDIRDIKLSVQSAFASVTGGGESLAKLAITGKIGLDALAAELKQFVDMQQVQLAGNGDFALNTDGDLTSENAPVLVKATANFQNLRISGVADQRIDQDRLAFQASGNVAREKNLPTQIKDGYVAIVGGDPASPLLDVEATGIVDLNKSGIPWFELKKCTITSLPKLQEQYGGLVPALAAQKIKIESGSFIAVAAGSFDGTTLAFAKPAGLSIPTLTISKDGRRILDREILRASLNGKVSIKDGIGGEFTDLSVTTESKLFTLTKGGTGPLTFNMTKKGTQSTMTGNGAMMLAADLKRLTDLAQAFGGQVTVSPDQPQLKSGMLNGTLTLAKASQPQTDLKFEGQITSLTIASATTPIAQNETLAINLTAAAPDDLNANPISANGKITGSFINATLSDAKIAPNGPPLDMLRSAVVDAQVTDLPKAYALVSAVSAQPATMPSTLAPLQVTSGSANLRMNIARDTSTKTTTLTIADAHITRLALKRGQQQYPFDSATAITFKATAAVQGTDTVDSLRVTELSADARIATLSMPEPISITGLATGKPVYQGSIQAKGKLEDATPLLAVLQGAPAMPYMGQYALAQKVSSRATDGVVTLVGSVDVNDFRVLAENRKDVAFSEPQIAIRNDLGLDVAAKKLAVTTLSLAMPKSQALGLTFVGGINAWDTARQIRPGTKLDVTYDLEKVWMIVRPMLSPEQQASYKDLKVAGKYQRSFTLSGAFPAAPTINRSFASLSAEGSLAIDLLDTMGLNIQKLQPKITMRTGRVLIEAPPAVANDGTLDISGIAMDLTQADPVLSIPRNKKLLANVKLNPVLANSLGKFASVIFSNTSDASGLCDVTVVEFNQVPLGALVSKQKTARARVVFAVRDLRLDSIPMQIIGAPLGFGSGGLRGRIPDSTLTLADGVANSDVSIELDREGERRGQRVTVPSVMRFAGGMGLEKFELHDFVVTIPAELLPREARQYLPNGLKVPLTGTADKPKFDFAKALATNTIGNIIPGVGGGNNEDPLRNLGGILNQLGGRGNQPPPQNQPPRNRGQ